MWVKDDVFLKYRVFKEIKSINDEKNYYILEFMGIGLKYFYRKIYIFVKFMVKNKKEKKGRGKENKWINIFNIIN